MFISNSEIRARARETLGKSIFDRNWIILILMSLLTSVIFSAANSIGCGLGTFVLSGPLYVGLYKAFLRTVRDGVHPKFDTVFEGCYDFGSNLVLGLMHTLIITFWSLLCLVPGIIKSYSYALVYYIKADNPEYSWRECLQESERMMRGNKWRLFKLNFSFIGWMILSIFTCGIGAFWVSAYQVTAISIFYEELKQQSNFAYTYN